MMMTLSDVAAFVSVIIPVAFELTALFFLALLLEDHELFKQLLKLFKNKNNSCHMAFFSDW